MLSRAGGLLRLVVVLAVLAVGCGGQPETSEVPVVSFPETGDEGWELPELDDHGGSPGVDDQSWGSPGVDEGWGLPGIDDRGLGSEIDGVEGGLPEIDDVGGGGAGDGGFVGGDGGGVVVVVDGDGVVVSGGVDGEAGVVLDGDGNVVFDGVIKDVDGNVIVDGDTIRSVCGRPGPPCVRYVGTDPLEEGGRLWAPFFYSAKWEPWVGEVLDMCNNHEALVAMNGVDWVGRGDDVGSDIDYSVVLDSFHLAEVIEERRVAPIVCSEAEALRPRWDCWSQDREAMDAYLGGSDVRAEPSVIEAWIEDNGLGCWNASARRGRYVFITEDGPLQARASVQAALQGFEEYLEFYGGVRPWAPRDARLGSNSSDPYFTVGRESRADELVVLPHTVTVINGVVRGLAQNLSWRLWARNAAVSVLDPSGIELEWQFLLTIQPGEVMAFETEGWTGTQDPSEIAFEVTADLSPTIDLSRSLRLGVNKGWHSEESLLEFYPRNFVDEIPDGEFWLNDVRISRQEPEGHPRLAEAFLEHTAENLTVYAARYLAGVGVVDVVELTPRVDAAPPPPDWFEIHNLPQHLPNPYPGNQRKGFENSFEIVGEYEVADVNGYTYGTPLTEARVGLIPTNDNLAFFWAGGAQNPSEDVSQP